MARFVLTLVVVAWVSPVFAGPAAARQKGPAASEAPNLAEAYHQFLRGRRLDQAGDLEAAVAAYRRALELDPRAADVAAELAGLYARENRADEAIAEAERALAIDADNHEAHRILGLIYVSRANLPRQAEEVGGALNEPAARQAVAHLEKARAPYGTSPAVGLTLGRLHLQLRDTDRAVQVLRELLVHEPGMGDASLMLASALDSAGRIDEARAVLTDAVDLDPAFLQAILALAELDEQRNAWPDAAETYGRAVALNPGDPALGARYAASLLNAGRAEEARDHLKARLVDRPNDRTLLYLLSQAHRQAEEPDEAEAAARRIMTLDAGDLRGPLALAQLLQDRRAPREVIALLDPLVASARIRGTSGAQLRALLVLLGTAHLELMEYEVAIQIFTQALRAGPADATTEARLVQALIGDRQYARALGALKDSRARYPEALALAQLEAEALRGSGQIERGVSTLEAFVRAYPDRADAHTTLAAFLAGSRRYDEAVGVLEQASPRFPRNVSIAFQLGATLEQHGRHPAAEEAFRRVIASDPLHAPALNYLGYMLADRGERLDEAVDFIKRALALDPTNAAYLDSLGWAYFKLNRLDLARPALERAAAALAADSVVQDHLGDVLFKAGERVAALAAWRRALEGDGESIDRTVIARKIRQAQDVR